MIITDKQEKKITKVTKVTDKKFALLGGPFVRTYKMIFNVQTLGHTNVEINTNIKYSCLLSRTDQLQSQVGSMHHDDGVTILSHKDT